MSHMIPADDDLAALRGEVGVLRTMVSLFFLLVLLTLLGLNLTLLWKVPQSEKIFEDMLGSKDKLPELTKAVLGYVKLGGNLWPMLFVLFPTIVCCVLVLSRRSIMIRAVVPALWMGFLVLHYMVVSVAVQSPMMQIIEGISGGPGR
jgi:hypothetical protein